MLSEALRIVAESGRLIITRLGVPICHNRAFHPFAGGQSYRQALQLPSTDNPKPAVGLIHRRSLLYGGHLLTFALSLRNPCSKCDHPIVAPGEATTLEGMHLWRPRDPGITRNPIWHNVR